MIGPKELSTDSGLAEQLARNAAAFPEKIAILYPIGHGPSGATRYGELTYGQLQADIDQLAGALSRIGVRHGTRTVLMAAAGPDLFALLFALLRIGAVPVVVDPGMGVGRMLHCYRAVGAEAFIGPPVAQVVRMLGRRTFAHVRVHVTLGRRWTWGGHTLRGLRAARVEPPVPGVDVRGQDLMMIGFTTGSTGPAKGVEYTHAMAAAMARAVQHTHARTPEEVSLVTLPLYGMLDLIFGSTLVVAPVSPTAVGQADPALLLEAVTRFRVTTMFASPALLRPLAEHLARHPTPLPYLRCVVSGGAPVPPGVVGLLRRALPERAAVHVTYGATEALPISSIECAELLGDTAAGASRGEGSCVGRPVVGVQVRVIRITDAPLPSWHAGLAVAAGEVGEIAVCGPSVSTRYHATPGADATHKIIDDRGRIWHRTGDLGRFDPQGRLWFCGRKTQRVRTRGGDLHTVACEGVFNAHHLVRRSALVGVGEAGEQHPVVCVETEPGVTRAQWGELVVQLRQMGSAWPQTAELGVFVRRLSFPVDVRHNAKIDREWLARWAGRRPARVGRAWLLRAVPLAGWVYLVSGLVRPTHDPVLVALWWITAFLSIAVHGAQIPQALARGRTRGYRPAATAVLTMLFGATWWRLLPEVDAQRVLR